MGIGVLILLNFGKGGCFIWDQKRKEIMNLALVVNIIGTLKDKDKKHLCNNIFSENYGKS